MGKRRRPPTPLRALAEQVTDAIEREASALEDASTPARPRFDAACDLIDVGRHLQGRAADLRSQIVRNMLEAPEMTMPKVASELGVSVPAVAKIAHRGRYDKRGHKLK